MGPYYWINQNKENWDPEHIWKTAAAEVGAILYGRVLGDPKCVDGKKQEIACKAVINVIK